MLTICAFDNTGFPRQYFSPIHILRSAGFLGKVWVSLSGSVRVDGSTYASHGCCRRRSAKAFRSTDETGIEAGGYLPATVTVDIKPWRCNARHEARWSLVINKEVEASRAFEQFCRCEQTFERSSRDIMIARKEWNVDLRRAVEKRSTRNPVSVGEN